MCAARPGAPSSVSRSTVVAVVLVVVGLLAGSMPVAAQGPTPLPLPPAAPTITSVSPAVVKPGAKLTIKGKNFVQMRGVLMAGVSLDYKVKNRRRIEARAPRFAARGPVTVSTRGGAINSPRQVVVKPRLGLAPGRGPIGATVSIDGGGYIPGEPVDVYLGRLPVTTTAADGKGEISTFFAVPARTVAGPSFVRAQGRFSGVPTDRAFTVGASWPQRGLTAGGNRRSSDAYLGATFSPSLRLDWVADTLGPSSSSPVVTGDVVVAGTDTGAVMAMPSDCASGGESCAAQAIGITRGPVSGAPAIARSVVYVASEDASVYALDLACGEDEAPCEPVWSYETGGPILSSPAVDDDVVVVGSSDGNVYGFDLACGLESDAGANAESTGCTPRWVGATGGPIASSPSIHDGIAYIGSDDGYLYAFRTDCAVDGGSCEPLWRGWTGGAVRSSPSVASGIVYVGSHDGKVHGFAIGCGDDNAICLAIWRGEANAPIESAPVIADGYVVVGADDGSVQAFPTACADRVLGCAPLWKAQTAAAVRSSPAISDATAQGGPMVFVGSDDGFLYGYPLKCRPTGNPAICSAIWASGTSGPITASPSIVDGAVYVSSEDGTVRRWSLP